MNSREAQRTLKYCKHFVSCWYWTENIHVGVTDTVFTQTLSMDCPRSLDCAWRPEPLKEQSSHGKDVSD